MSRIWFLKFSTFLITVACLTIMVSASLVGLNFKKAVGFWGENLEVVGYLAQNSSEAVRTELLRKIEAMVFVKKVEYFSEERSFNEFVSQSATLLPGFKMGPEMQDVAPASIVVTLKDSSDPDENIQRISSLAEQMKTLDGIEEVSYSSEIIQKFSSLTSMSVIVLYILGTVLGLSSILIISNAVHASIFQRREEIEIYELIGATTWMVRRPFLREAGAIGFFAGGTALILCKFIFATLINSFASHATLIRISQSIEFYSVGQCLVILLGSAAFGTLAAYFCLSSINTNWAAAKRGSP